MALTAARRIALFQALEVPLFPQRTQLYEDGSVGQVKDVTSSVWRVPLLIDNHLTTYVYVDPTGIQATLESALDAWIALGTDTTAIQQGSIGNISGIDYRTQDEREEIRKQILVICPFYRCHIEMERAHSAEIDIIR